MRYCNIYRRIAPTLVMGMLVCGEWTAVQAADSSLPMVSATGDSDSMLMNEALDQRQLVLKNQHSLGGTRILMGTSTLLLTVMPWGISQISSGIDMTKETGTPLKMVGENSQTLAALVRQNRMQLIDQQRWVGRTALGLGGMLMIYGLAGTAGAIALWFVHAYDGDYMPLALGATVLDVGFYVGSIVSFKRARRNIVEARAAKRSMTFEADPVSAMVDNRRLIVESRKRIGGLRMAIGTSVLIIAAGGAVVSSMVWMMENGFERNVIGSISAAASLGIGFLGGYLLATGAKMRRGVKVKSSAVNRMPRLMLQPVFTPASGRYSAIGGVSLGTSF